MSAHRQGCWLRLGLTGKCVSCSLRLVILRLVWSDTARDAVFCEGCAAALGAPPPTEPIFRREGRRPVAKPVMRR